MHCGYRQAEVGANQRHAWKKGKLEKDCHRDAICRRRPEVFEYLTRSYACLGGLAHAPDLAVEPEAQLAVDRIKYGFEPVASADVFGPSFRTIFSYSISPNLRSHAVATDKLECLDSRFGDRLLVTVDLASLPTLPIVLRQLVRWQRLIGRLPNSAVIGDDPDAARRIEERAAS